MVERAWWEEQAQFAHGPTGKEQGADKLVEDEEASITWQVLPGNPCLLR